MTTPYAEQVADAFLQTPAEEFGDAHATAFEIDALSALYKQSGRDRATTIQAIVESGYPLPENITPEMVALTGAAHACGVAIDLAETRGIEGKDSTYESYVTKNRFDRFVARHLPQSLKSSWAEPIEREAGYINPAIMYPESVDDGLIHGIAKPSRYFPAQTMRYLEFARLGKLDGKTAEQFGIDKSTDMSKFGVLWGSLVPTIEGSTDLVQLSANISSEVAKNLISNGLNHAQVAAVLQKGYSLDGMQKEHGKVKQTDEVYAALIDTLQSSPETEAVASILTK